MNYVQCKLIQYHKNDEKYLVTYISRKLAKRDRILNVEMDSGVWELWKVLHIYPNTITDDLINVNRMVKTHKSITGDSLPNRKRKRSK